MTITVSNEGTMKRRVLDHLSKGNTLSAAQASSKFGVKNFRALISNIKSQVEMYGNWSVYSDTNSKGSTMYGMEFEGYTDNPFAIRAGIVD